MPSPAQPEPNWSRQAIQRACGSPVVGEWENWRWQLEHSIRTTKWVAEVLHLSLPARYDEANLVASYPMSVTPYYLALAQRPHPDDPILRQCLPDMAELRDAEDASPDPLEEERDSPVPGLIHRYPDRVLLVTTNRCATYCRHCMRKRAWKRPDHTLPAGALDAVCAYLGEHPEVREVIVSGGDPLLLPEEQLWAALERIHAIRSVEMVRIGTRLPAVLPQRLTADFCERLAAFGPVWLATHFNHPLELTEEASQACGTLCRAGIPVVNQTVLLKGVNDDARVLQDLFTGLLRMRVKPYYLFHGDPVAGTLHFRTGVDKGLAIMRQLRGRLSGLALPAFAIDLPGGHGKVRLEPPACCGRTQDGALQYRSYRGTLVSYA